MSSVPSWHPPMSSQSVRRHHAPWHGPHQHQPSIRLRSTTCQGHIRAKVTSEPRSCRISISHQFVCNLHVKVTSEPRSCCISISHQFVCNLHVKVTSEPRSHQYQSSHTSLRLVSCLKLPHHKISTVSVCKVIFFSIVLLIHIFTSNF